MNLALDSKRQSGKRWTPKRQSPREEFGLWAAMRQPNRFCQNVYIKRFF